ncbi:NAD(P)H-flavin reductase [Vibrio stylophorae]|uniref:NAD(P)H-flavin reductase n=1 Tax=Vibrio stylophorae TaxID=659351 RepID=A0ABN8DPK8_9VIBR|nr:NAD(P)H-flavin reductase [Vibrio stylophorae]CAH0532248.1 NAD(P)H-flavin reductase [Vibrio stylophorae]
MTIECQVKAIESVAAHTYQITLSPLAPVPFLAGQYAMAVMGEKDKRPFSIASAPANADVIELHIGAAQENAYALDVVRAMETALASQETVMLDLPHGEAWLREDQDKPILLIAGGTGFSYVYSILQRQLARQSEQPVYLYWGCRDQSQLYYHDQLQALAEQYPQLHYRPVVEHVEGDWQGRQGMVLDAVMHDFDAMGDLDIYIAGRFEMAATARDWFSSEKGAERGRMFADAYAFI